MAMYSSHLAPPSGPSDGDLEKAGWLSGIYSCCLGWRISLMVRASSPGRQQHSVYRGAAVTSQGNKRKVLRVAHLGKTYTAVLPESKPKKSLSSVAQRIRQLCL